MIWLIVTIVVLAFCAWKCYDIWLKSDTEMANAHAVMKEVNQQITDKRAIKAEIEQDIKSLQEAAQLSLHSRMAQIDKEFLANNQSLGLKKVVELLQYLQPSLDELCKIILTARQDLHDLDDKTLLESHALAALGSANAGDNAPLCRQLLQAIEKECALRYLATQVLTPSALVASWGKS